MSRLEASDWFLWWAQCFVLRRAQNVHNRLSCVNNCDDQSYLHMTLVNLDFGNLCFSLQRTFHYEADLWENKNAFNLPGAETGFDSEETKLPTYWETPFSKICLGMKIGQQIRFMVINKQADSLYSLIADGQLRATSLSREKWKSLIGPEGSLQPHCNTQGFNAVGTNPDHSKARIGITANQENDCSSCDSRIGFGTGGYPDDSNTCGNEARHSPDNGDKHIKAFGYILVQWKERTLRIRNIVCCLVNCRLVQHFCV